MCDPNNKQPVIPVSQLQWANPCGYFYEDKAYEIQENHCIYLGNSKIWVAELQQERYFKGHFKSTLDEMSIGKSFILETKRKSGSMIISIKDAN